MLIEFRVDNYKSLINGVFAPQGLNLLLGANNSGKTNLSQALQFVSGSAVVPLDQCADRAARGRFGMTNFTLDKSTIDFYVRAQVSFRDEELLFEYELTHFASTHGRRRGGGQASARSSQRNRRNLCRKDNSAG